MNKFSKFLHLSLKRKWLLIRTWFLMQAVAVGLRVLRVDSLLGILGTNRPNKKTVPEAFKEDVLWSIRACIPLSMKSTCVVQGLTAERLLRKAGFLVTFRIGVIRQDVFRAHAWVEDATGTLIGNTQDELQPFPSITGADLDQGSLKLPQ